jgi:hypothetical protein
MCTATQDIENETAGDNSMIKQIGKKKRLAHSRAETVSAWKCYRCNLIFHEESLVLLHEDISHHSAGYITPFSCTIRI